MTDVCELVPQQNPCEQDEGIHFSVSWMVKVMDEAKNTVSLFYFVWGVLRSGDLLIIGGFLARSAGFRFVGMSLLNLYLI